MNWLVSPVIRSANGVANGLSDFGYGLVNAHRLTEQNRALRDQLQVIALYSETTDRLEREIDDLRAWHYLPHSPGKTRVFSDIEGYFPYENRLTLLVGSADGVGIGMPVESPRGLVGTVQTVEPHRCQVALLASAGLKIGAVDGSRNPSPAGLLSGESSSKLTLVFEDPEAPVSLGDQILTSGFSDRIPAGIPIGRVIAVDYNPEFGTRKATVFPAVQVGELREVAVLK